MHPPPFQHVVLHGMGLLGTSLGLALKKHRLATAITGVGRPSSPSLDIAKARNAIDHATTDLAAAVHGNHLHSPADLVVLCTPVRQFPAALRTLAASARPRTLITDVGSTKADVLRWAKELLPDTLHFIGSHPMAGSEKSGPDAARDNLYEHAVCLLCTHHHQAPGVPFPPASSPAPASNPPSAPPPPLAQADAAERAAFERIRQLWLTLGMRIIDLPADMHDRWVATISHLPHAVAFTLVETAARHPEMLEAVAGGFIDTTRVASSDVAMWTDIFLTNKPAVLAALDTFTHDLQALRTAIAGGDEITLREHLRRAKDARDALIERRRAAGLATRHAPRGEEP